MPDVSLPFPQEGKSTEETVKNLYDTVMKLRKELEWLLYNLDTKNVLVAKRAEISELYAGTIEANKITTAEGTITTAQIENLEVGDNVTMGANAYISWNNVTDQPTIPEGYTWEDWLANAITATYIDGQNVWTPNVYATNISVLNGKISAAQIDTLSADQITAGTLQLGDDIIATNDDNSVYMDKDGIAITNGKISIKDVNGNQLFIDGYGIDPSFLRWFPNLLANSEFTNAVTAVADPTVDFTPKYWSGGVSSYSATFIGQRSMVIDEAS